VRFEIPRGGKALAASASVRSGSSESRSSEEVNVEAVVRGSLVKAVGILWSFGR